MKATPTKLIANYLCAMAIIGTCYWFYQLNPYYQGFFSSTHVWPWFRVTDQQLFFYGAVAFAVLLPPYYATFADSFETKSFLFWRAIYKLPSRRPTSKERVALRATLVKAFFLPLMVAWFFANGADVFQQAANFTDKSQFFPHGYWTLFKLIILIDVAFFAIAYSVEHPALGNVINSVEPTILGWVVALICYPPFNGMTNQMLGWYSSDFPEIHTTWLQYFSGVSILLLMSVYLWATIALNIKASNLTNRGIVTSGPYKYIRHPAYVCKNLAWWIGALPILVSQYGRGVSEMMFAIFCVLAWSYIYYLRAVTEEKHLLQDPDYKDYFDRVPGFIPRFNGQ